MIFLKKQCFVYFSDSKLHLFIHILITGYLQAALQNTNSSKCEPNCSRHNDSNNESVDNCKDSDGQSAPNGCCNCDAENCSIHSDDCTNSLHHENCGCDFLDGECSNPTERHSSSPLQSCSNFLPEYCTSKASR